MFLTNTNKYGYKTVLLDPLNRLKAKNKSNTKEAKTKNFKTRRITTIKVYNNFHLYKTVLAEENNIRLVHIRSDMWLNDNTKTKKLIKNIILGNIDFSQYTNKELLIIDRSLFNKAWNFNGYTLINIIEPKILNLSLNKRQYKYLDCGKLIYLKDISKYIY